MAITPARDGRDTVPAPSVLGLRRAWSGLTAPSLDALVGDLAASFVPPLRTVAGAGLGLIGLPRWYGKRFAAGAPELAGVNLVRAGAALREVLPMTARVAPSLLDGAPAIVITYASDAPRPWRWVRDEVREGTDGVLVGMTVVDVAALRGLGGTPFLLRRTTT